ncbi:lipase family protein [Corynebacterium tapiri]|uniref:Lipase n=1 Tax=Corynebacterium tapiri TaxID=1448266 RepID=A0A5C4U2A0_9CORY|nr:lipase family protein [Corynebacterium tapiri]TNL96052.1 lipase [Corynebacterium tapiri]
MKKIATAAFSALLCLSTPLAHASSFNPHNSPELQAGSSLIDAGSSAIKDSGIPSPSSFDASDPFYDPPAELPATAGQIIRTQPTEHIGPLLASATKILYTSSTVHGDIVPVSGLLLEPTAPWRGSGPRPTVVMAPGTRGGADACAPSRSAYQALSLDAGSGNLNANYEIPFAYAAASAGMRVVVTDYIGLGTPGPHTYVLHTEEGNAVLDAARAGLQASGSAPDSPVGFWGYSQGGGSVAAAAERAASYAPDLNVKGVYSGAPPANLPEVIKAVDGSSIIGVLGISLVGYPARYPELNAEIDRIFNEKGKRFIEDSANSCISDAAKKWGLMDSRTLTNSGKSMAEEAANSELLHSYLSRENLGQHAPVAPVMISSSKADDIIPNFQVEQLAKDYCSLGGKVFYYNNGLDSLTSSQPYAVDHAVGMFTDAPASFAFLNDRFNDVPMQHSC